MTRAATGDDAQALRDELAREIAREASDTQSWTGRARFADRVMDAIRAVPRHLFIPSRPPLSIAYANRPQPIGFGQTISQPYIVALMTDLLDLKGHERVLEIGAGCGYQTAVLAACATEIFSVERIQELARLAQDNLAEAAVANAHIRHGDGAQGWPERAPFDAIIVTACQDGPVPRALIDQLAPGGRMVIPLGPQWGPQMLHLGLKDAQGRFSTAPLLPVAFVPLVTRP